MVKSPSNQKLSNPIKERIGEEMFTDREEEMASLMRWADTVARKREKSMALVSPRRHGKTAIMERFYNRLFWERDDVVPFYYELKEDKLWLRDFVHDYYFKFQRQFFAYQVKDASIAFNEQIDEEQLYRLAMDTKIESVQIALDRLSKRKDEPYADNFFHTALQMPHSFAAETGISVVVMFDEFQRLDEVLYYDAEKTRKCHPYTGSFSSAVESSWAPMLIAGSQVAMLTRRALGGAMAGRVRRKYIKRLPLEGGAELAHKLAKEQQIDLPLELAYTISTLTKGHPYYIWCLFHSEMTDCDLSTEAGVQAVLEFEVKDPLGQINEFWRDHFLVNMGAINEINAKRMIFYLMKHPSNEVPVDEIVDELNLPLTKEEANQKLRQLVWGDLIRESGGSLYSGLSDPMLDRVLRIEYSWELSQLRRSEMAEEIRAEFSNEILAAKDTLIDSLRGQLNYWIGRIAEVFIDKLMKRHFNGQMVDGERYFHSLEQVRLSAFKSVYTTFTQPHGATRAYQIDLYAEPRGKDDRPWVVEIKNWQQPVGTTEVSHFLNAAENLAQDKAHPVLVKWFYARSGFTKPAEALLKENAVLYTDQTGLHQLLQDFNVVDLWQDEEGTSEQ